MGLCVNSLVKIFSKDKRSVGQHAGYQAAALAVSLGMGLAGGTITGLEIKLPVQMLIKTVIIIRTNLKFWIIKDVCAAS